MSQSRQAMPWFVSLKFCKVNQGHLKLCLWLRCVCVCKFLYNIPLYLCSYLAPFLRYSASNNGIILICGIGVVEGHWKWSNMTVGQSSLIYLAHHCYDWHPESRCCQICNQLTSKVDGGIVLWRKMKSAQVINSHLVCDPTIRQPGFDLPRQQWSLLNRFHTE